MAELRTGTKFGQSTFICNVDVDICFNSTHSTARLQSANSQHWHSCKGLGRVNCPCPEQGQNLNSQLSSALFVPILPTEPEDHDQAIHRVPVNGLIVILRFHVKNWSRSCTWKLAIQISALFGTGTVYPTYDLDLEVMWTEVGWYHLSRPPPLRT